MAGPPGSGNLSLPGVWLLGSVTCSFNLLQPDMLPLPLHHPAGRMDGAECVGAPLGSALQIANSED